MHEFPKSRRWQGCLYQGWAACTAGFQRSGAKASKPRDADSVHPVTVQVGCRQTHENAALLQPVCTRGPGSEPHHLACRPQAACAGMALARRR